LGPDNLGFGLNLGVELAPRAFAFPIRRPPGVAKPAECGGYRQLMAASAAVKIIAVGIRGADDRAPQKP
jgi:hypothetical protein